MMYKLFDLADVIRSKNSGPYEMTFDIIFKDEKIFRRVTEAEIFTPESFARLYGLKAGEVLNVVNFPPARAIKITIARPRPSGSLGETDVYGAQQHGPLMKHQFEM